MHAAGCLGVVMSSRPRSLIGLDIGGTKIACVEGSRDGHILQRFEIATKVPQPFAQTLPSVLEMIRRQMTLSNDAGRDVVALSVSVGGPLHIREGVLRDPPHLPGWHNVRLKERLAKAFPGLPVHVEHDGNAGALAEFHFGAGRARLGLEHLIFLTFGTGLGGGFIINGRILHGATDTAGEIGHWRLSDEGPEGYGKRGSWEGFASGAGLVQLASLRCPRRWRSATSIAELVDAMLANDADALAVAREAGEWLGRGLALLIDALNPQLIVLGSLAAVLGDRVLEPARRVVAEEALPQAVAACEIVPAVLGKRVGDVAALMAGLTDSYVLGLMEE